MVPEGKQITVGDLVDLSKEKKIKAEIYSDSSVLNPFSTLIIRFYEDKELLLEEQTIFKCDYLGNCHFCFTADFSNVVLTKGRERVVIPTKWVNVLTFNHCPVFEEQFYQEIIVRHNHLVAKKENLLLVENFKRLLMEKQEKVYRLVLDNNLSNPIFTVQVNLEVF